MENRLASITRIEAAFLLGVTPSQISRLKGQGLPVNPDGRTHNARSLLLWDADRSEASAGCAENSATLQVLAKWRTEKYRIARIDRRERERKLVAWAEVERAWIERIVLVCSGLEVLADRISGIAAGKSRNEVFEIIKSEVKHFRKSFAREGQYTPPPFDTEAFAAEVAAIVRKFSEGAENGKTEAAKA